MERLTQIAQTLKNQDCFYILTHTYPDGDALGSSFALCRALQQSSKKARVICKSPIPSKYSFLSNYVQNQNFKPTCIISVDLSDTKLLDPEYELYKNKINICIDHHPSNSDYAGLTYVDSDAASTCEIIYDLINIMNINIDKQTAECLYTGIATDTGCFKYSNTTAKTHLITSKLMEAGINSAKINEDIFITKTSKKLKIENTVYNNIKYFFEGKCALTHITLSEMEKIGVKDSEVEGIASLAISIEGVMISFTLRQKVAGEFKASVRTRESIDANELCKEFGGGGHARSGGFTIHGELQEINDKITNTVKLKLGW